jgi:hypothetical protein
LSGVNSEKAATVLITMAFSSLASASTAAVMTTRPPVIVVRKALDTG